jgi:aminopeptidase N
MAQVADQPAFWRSPLVDMGAGNEFTRVYDRGPLAVHALRAELGEETFAALLTGWVQQYSGRNASWEDFETFVSDLAGRDLRPFLDAWFRGTEVPPAEFRYPGNLAG